MSTPTKSLITKFTHAPIIPLIGGQTLGVSRAFNAEPEYIMSFKAFYNNDKQLLNYYKEKQLDIPYYVLDNEDHNDSNLKYVDVVHSVCPCAGLSTLSNSKQRGSNSPTNDWMYICAEKVLSTIKPKVYFGENAPILSSAAGKGVAKKLNNIANKYGYVFSMYRTKSLLHNNPQKRLRTFYFFWKKDNVDDVNRVPILDYYNKTEHSNIKYYLDAFEKEYNDIYSNSNTDSMTLIESKSSKPSDDILYKYIINNVVKEPDISMSDFITKYIEPNYDNSIHFYNFIEKYTNTDLKTVMNNLNEYFQNNIINKNDDIDIKISRYIRSVKKMADKLNSGKGILFNPSIFATKIIPTLTWKTSPEIVHYKYDRYLTLRELMYIMNLPLDFNIVFSEEEKTKNHFGIKYLTQNVPANTACDIAKSVFNYLSNLLQYTDIQDSEYIIQNNVKQQVNILKW